MNETTGIRATVVCTLDSYGDLGPIEAIFYGDRADEHADTYSDFLDRRQRGTFTAYDLDLYLEAIDKQERELWLA